MRVYLADLSYLEDWDYVHPVPLNVGYIGAYLKKIHPDVHLELFKHPAKLMERCKSAPPDVLGLSQYTWNVNLNFAVTKRLKEIRPDALTVVGGPFFDAESPAWITKFFSDRPQLDAYVVDEGEWSFARLVTLLKAHGGRFADIPVEQRPASFYAFDRAAGTIIHNPHLPPEAPPLEEYPSPYLTGLLDPFLEDKHLCPLIETNRGCPYSCTFCTWGGSGKQKIRLFPLERVYEELRYACARAKNPTGRLYVADGNFGINARDLEISKVIRECSETIGYPKFAYVYYAKNAKDSIIEIAKNLKATSSMSMSKQSMNPTTLEFIKRKNISQEKIDELQAECERQGINTFSELIYGLPGETYETFIKGVVTTVRSNQLAVLYPFRLDRGAEAATQAYRDRFKLGTAFRVLPRYVGVYDDLAAMEYDEIVVQSDGFSREDFLRIRLFHFLIFIFTLPGFVEMKRGLEFCDQDYATLADRIVRDEENWPPLIGAWLEEFRQACRDELLDTTRVKTEFTVDDVKGMHAKEVALNPLYMARLVTRHALIGAFRAYLIAAVDRFFGDELAADHRDELKTAIGFSCDRLIDYENLEPAKTVRYDYDIQAWLTGSKAQSLEAFRRPEATPCTLSVRPDVLTAFKDTMTWARGVEHAVYMLRMHVIGLSHGDAAFCYEPPVPMAAAVSTAPSTG